MKLKMWFKCLDICIMTPDKKKTKWPGSMETSAEPDAGITSLTVTLELQADKFTFVITWVVLIAC